MTDIRHEPIIGIDLGTTNSEVAIVHNDKIIVLKVDGSCIVPSVVSLNGEGEVLVGHPAVNNELANPSNTLRKIKRKMGLEETISLGEHSYTPSMAASLILKRLKLAAEDFLGCPVTKAVITVPAFFTEKEREATNEAARLAGLEAVSLLNEPTAAALAYSMRKKEKELCLIYDLGGGTFDVSIVYLSPELMEVKASHGDTALGGSDIDLLIAEKIRGEFLKNHGVDLAADRLAWVRLMRAAEKAKIHLSTESSALLSEEFIIYKEGVPLHLNYTCLRTELEEMVAPLIERTLTSIRTALTMAEISADDLHRVILVGGMTQMPLVSQMLEQELHITPQAWIDPSTVVARGAAIEAASLAGQSIAPYMVDITPHSLGTGCLDINDHLYNHILIRRNSIIPCTASQIFYKRDQEQDKVRVDVYQGESRVIAQNRLLGEFALDGLEDSPGRAIHIKFHLDRSGILHVAASDVTTGKQIQRKLKKTDDLCKKNVDLTALESIRLSVNHNGDIQGTEFVESQAEDWEDDVSVEETGETTPIHSLDGEIILGKVQALLDKKGLNAADEKELQQELVKANAGSIDAIEKLANLLYYLE